MSQKNQLVSVIIPVYNGGSTLGQCLESLFRSSYPHFECIVVDDHSDDNSAAIAESFDTKIIRLERQRGAAYARNRGAETARGDILLFVDSDVTVYPDSLDKVVNALEKHPEISALFGSYDDRPAGQNFFSQYKNMFHHYVHQISQENASTFWCGGGAIRREIFNEVGGFDERRYSNASIEDIELGFRLKSMGHNILLFKDFQVKHLKRWTFISMLRADIFYRAVPWSKVILENHNMVSDLNLQTTDRISGGLVCLVAGMLPFLPVYPSLLYSMFVLLAVFVALNNKFYRFFLEKKGMAFVVPVFVMHLFYYLYSSVTFALCWFMHMFTRRKISSGVRLDDK
jgi:glycosyltransferase involved in cell wall biosynthesis